MLKLATCVRSTCIYCNYRLQSFDLINLDTIIMHIHRQIFESIRKMCEYSNENYVYPQLGPTLGEATLTEELLHRPIAVQTFIGSNSSVTRAAISLGVYMLRNVSHCAESHTCKFMAVLMKARQVLMPRWRQCPN